MILYTLAAIAVPSSFVVLYYMWIRTSRQTLLEELHKRCVFITGCDTGFGNTLAHKLDALGVPVFAGCLTEGGARDLKEKTSERLQTVLVDVGNHDSIQEAYTFVKTHLPSGTELWGVVNNAGVAGFNGPLEFMNPDIFRRIFNINFVGLADVTQTFMPLINQSRGRIVNTSSGSVLLCFKDMYPYLVSKAAVRAFTNALRMEKQIYGVKVACILPGFYDTPISDLEKYERQVRGNWESLPREVREHYGEEYVNTTIQNMVNITKKAAQPDTTPVIDAYTHALFAQYPRDEYFPGLEFGAFVISMCPLFVTKWISKGYSKSDQRVPEALKKIKS